MCPKISGFPRTNPMTWGWDASTINPTIFREGSGFIGTLGGSNLMQIYGNFDGIPKNKSA